MFEATLDEVLFAIACIVVGTWLSLMLGGIGKLIIDHLRCTPC